MKTIEQRYAEFNARNPHVFTQLETLARAAFNIGRRRIGIKHLFEVLRWNHYFNTRGEKWKLNNNYTSLYARDLLAKHPEWKGLFQTRKLTYQRANIVLNGGW
jgi:hypothetical protein